MPNADKDIHFDESDARAGCYEFGPYRLDARRRQLTRIDGSELEITGKVFDALLYFAQHPGVLIPRSALVTALWPDTVVEDNNLNKLIAALRRALGDAETYIVTVPGRGYQMVADVRVAQESPSAARSTALPVAASAPTGISAEDTSGSRHGTSGESALRSGHSWKLKLAGLSVAIVGLALVGFYGPWWNTRASVKPLGSVVRVTSGTSYLGDEASPSLSPDGRQVAFSWNGPQEGAEANQDIYVSTLDGAQPLRLTDDPAVDLSPVWAPDGRRIAFLRRRGPLMMDMMVVPALGGHERKLLTVQLRLTSHDIEPLLAWSADSERLVFTTQTDGAVDGDGYHLFALTIESGRLQRLTSTPRVYDASPALSSDQRWLAFTRYEIDQRLARLMLQKLGDDLEPDGAPFLVPGVQAGEPKSPTWSRDGKRLVFVNNRGIYEWEFKGEARLIYAPSGPAGSTRYGGFSLHRGPEGTHGVLAIDAAPADIWALPLDPVTHAATGPAVRHAASSAIDNHPQFSPDGRHFAFVSWRSGRAAVWIADANGTRPRQLTDMDVFVVGFPRWSPDGGQLAVHLTTPGKKRQIYIISVETGSMRRLADGCCPEWTSDGNYLYVNEVGGVNFVARLRVADGNREQLFTGELPRLTRDGTRLIYARTKQPGLFMRSVAGDLKSNPEEKLVDDYVATLGGVATTVDGFFYVSYTEQGIARAIRFYEYALHAARDIAGVPASVEHGLTVSPDGRTLLYSASAKESGVDLVKLEFN